MLSVEEFLGVIYTHCIFVQDACQWNGEEA